MVGFYLSADAVCSDCTSTTLKAGDGTSARTNLDKTYHCEGKSGTLTTIAKITCFLGYGV